ncbi:MAG: glycoside hydrolase family 3 C-terminal domain-containing protein [Deltaproteobacteria bacterium]|nr:glycoside hydrolase family 3 C-terminal domain-containing protein [Deltaproteobacteria bacterium]MBW2417185.1 glycoside hydrolase family 3 C-terminal domain-containing protein [Deltaproteobacteria bacterium]
MQQDPPFRDASLPVEERAEDLLGHMSPEEKIAQLGCVWSTQLVEDDAFSPAKAKELLHAGTGQVTRIGASTGLRPCESAAFMNAIQRHLVEKTRLGIPAIVHEESTGGFTARDADQLPQGIGLASTWDPVLVEAGADLIRQQMLAVGARQTLAPVLDIARDPRWGRVEETYGEDPYLTSRMGVAYVRGVQGSDLRRGVAATAKHFLGYGLSEGGHNHRPAHIGPRELREVFARPFLAAIAEADLASVMNAYNDVDGLPCGGSKAILDDLLRGELGFEGLVVADYFTVMLLVSSHRVAADKADAAQMALEAGLDVELPATDCYAELAARLADGRLATEFVDRSLRRVLRLKLELGLFEEPYVDESAAAATYQTPRSRELARELARKSLVLLRNEGNLLPLDPDIGSIAVIGPCADDPRLLQGDYHYPAHLEIIYGQAGDDPAGILPRSGASAFAPGPYFPPTTTPLEGIRQAVSARSEVRHARGCDVLGNDAEGLADALAAARAAEVAVVFVGGRSGLVNGCTSGEFRDASELGLTGLQQRLVEEVVATGTPTVVVLVSGRVLALPWIASHVPAIVEAWLPGEEGGGAIADLLFGSLNPSGRLPVSLPRSVGQLPVYHYQKWSGGDAPGATTWPNYTDGPAAPLFPFGHGLSYTRFEYSELQLSSATIAADQAIEISLAIHNAGERAGEEVVQLYLQDPVASVTRPLQQLAGFARVALAAGERRRIRFVLDPSQLAFYDRAMNLVVEAGEVRVRAGASSRDIRLEGSFDIECKNIEGKDIEGKTRSLEPREIRPTRVEIEGEA